MSLFTRLTNKLSEVKSLVKLLQRLKLADNSENADATKDEEDEYNDSVSDFDLESHLVENYDEYYEEYGTTNGNVVFSIYCKRPGYN